MKKNFYIIIGSPIDYDQLVAYIVINGDHVALLNQDEGVDNLKLEFFDEPRIKSLDYELFMEALQEAKRVLCG